MKLQMCYLVSAIYGVFAGIGIAVTTKHFILAVCIAVLLGASNVLKAQYLLDYDIKQAMKEGD